MSGDATIVPAGSYDATDLARLHAACFAEAWDRATFARLLAAQGVHGLIARAADTTLGFALLRLAADEAEMLSLGVDPAWRRHGLARRLTLRALDTARIRGAGTLFLEVARDNAPAQALYHGLGFVQVGVRKGYYARANAPVDALTLRRSLV